jgi:ribosomal protein S18 acetylase RimI-like enzyme
MYDIRRMTDDECAEVSELLRACFEWLADREGFNATQRDFLLNQRSSEQTVREEAKTRPHLVACEEGVILGMVVVNGNEISRLYVHPTYHRRGVGQALFEAAVQMIREAGFNEVKLGALVDSAVAFYKAMGMSVVGHEPYEPEIFLGREVFLMRKTV